MRVRYRYRCRARFARARKHALSLAGEHEIERNSLKDRTVFDKSEMAVAAEDLIAAANNISDCWIAQIE